MTTPDRPLDPAVGRFSHHPLPPPCPVLKEFDGKVLVVGSEKLKYLRMLNSDCMRLWGDGLVRGEERYCPRCLTLVTTLLVVTPPDQGEVVSHSPPATRPGVPTTPPRKVDKETSPEAPRWRER